MEVRTAEPVYDSSPSAHEKLDDSLFEGKFNYCCSNQCMDLGKFFMN